MPSTTLRVRITADYGYNTAHPGQLSAHVKFIADEYENNPVSERWSIVDNYTDTTTDPYNPVVQSLQEAIEYWSLTEPSILVSYVNSIAGVTLYTDYELFYHDPYTEASLLEKQEAHPNLDEIAGISAPFWPTVKSTMAMEIADVDGLSTALSGKANTSHTHTASEVTDFTEAAQDAVGAMVSPELVYTDGTPSLSLRARSFTNNASRSLTTSTGAAGFQVSSTRDAAVNYNVTSSTTATIGGASSITVVLEIAPTNSVTAGDWVEISRFSNGQTITLALALQSVQTGAGSLGGVVPAGYYAKLRTISSGTASASYNTGQEVLL